MSCLGKMEIYFARIRFTLYFFGTERIKHNTDDPGVMSDVGIYKYSGSSFHSTCEAYRSFYWAFSCDRVLIDAVQQCRYHYILQLRRYCSVYSYEMEVLNKRIQEAGLRISFNPPGDGMCFYSAAGFQLGLSSTTVQNIVFEYLESNRYDVSICISLLQHLVWYVKNYLVVASGIR
jgi:hypothetical protein